MMDLSADLVTEILVRLPVLTLLRCKWVCKLWLALINSPTFISKHLQLWNSGDPNLLVIADGYYYIVSVETLKFVRNRLPHFDIKSTDQPTMVGSCNGLVCMFGCGGGIIWNPATRETKVMPRCSVRGSETQAAAFGFDADNNDYKVCVINIFGNMDAPHGFKIEVYSLRTDSWKLVTGSEEVYILAIVGAYNKGVFSWVGHHVEDDSDGYIGVYGAAWKEVIISFDINTEMITMTPLPHEIGVHEPTEIHNYVGVKDGELVVLNERVPEDDESGLLERHLDLWKLSQIGNEESWEQIFEASRLLQWYSPRWVYWKNGLVFRRVEDSNLCLFDVKKQKQHKIEIPTENIFGMDFVTYGESLVRIN